VGLNGDCGGPPSVALMDVALPPDAEAEDLIEYMPCQDEVYHEVGVAATDYDGEEACCADMGLCGGFLPQRDR